MFVTYNPTVQRVTQSSVLQEKLREQVEEEAHLKLKAAETRLMQRLMAVMDAVNNRLGSLEEGIEAAVAQVQEAARHRQPQEQLQGQGQEQGQPEASADDRLPTSQEQAQALEAILGLARQAKLAILQDISERCEGMALEE